MRELFQVLDREDRISILKLLSLLIKESNKTTYNDNSDWILAFNEAGFRTDDININEILSNVDMDVYNVPLEDWQVQALNSICFLENILIFRYVPDNEPNIIRKSKFPWFPERSVQFSGKRTKRSVQKKGCTQHL